MLYTGGKDLHKGEVDNSFKIWVLPQMQTRYGVVFKEKDKKLSYLHTEGSRGRRVQDLEDDLLGWDKN